MQEAITRMLERYAHHTLDDSLRALQAGGQPLAVLADLLRRFGIEVWGMGRSQSEDPHGGLH